MKIINTDELQISLSVLLEDVVKKGEKILIYSKGKPVADLVPHKVKDRLSPHPVMKKITVQYDPTKPLTRS